jgi:hypothetical protein
MGLFLNLKLSFYFQLKQKVLPVIAPFKFYLTMRHFKWKSIKQNDQTLASISHVKLSPKIF